MKNRDLEQMISTGDSFGKVFGIHGGTEDKGVNPKVIMDLAYAKPKIQALIRAFISAREAIGERYALRDKEGKLVQPLQVDPAKYEGWNTELRKFLDQDVNQEIPKIRISKADLRNAIIYDALTANDISSCMPFLEIVEDPPKKP